MNVISISKQRFNGLEKFVLADINTEGELYSFPYCDSVKLLKKLYVNDGITLAKKLFTIEVLNSNPLPDYFVIPDSLVTVDNDIVGFTIPYIDGKTLKNVLYSREIPVEIKIKYLKKIGVILDDMASLRTNTDLKHFYLNDMHESNFMIASSTNQLYVVDLDGCKINASFSFPSRYLTRNALLNNANKYHVESDLRHGAYVMANKDSDLYCYIIIILNYLYGEYINNISIKEYYDYLNYLEFIGINKDLLDCFNKIVTDSENINPMDYLDSITETQIFRAKKKVYDIVRRKL